MSKQKKQPRDENKTLEEYSEYDDPLIRREIRSSYRGLIDVTQSECDLFNDFRPIILSKLELFDYCSIIIKICCPICLYTENKDELVKPESTGLQSVLDQAEDLFGKGELNQSISHLHSRDYACFH